MPIPRVRVKSYNSATESISRNTEIYREASMIYYNPTTALTWENPVTTDYRLYSGTKTTVDRVTPNFTHLMRKGKIVNNPFESTEIHSVDPLVNLTTQKTDYRIMKSIPDNYVVGVHPYQIDSWSGSAPASSILFGSGTQHLPVLSIVDIEEIKSRAVIQAWSRVNESEMLALATVAETGKSARDLHLLARKVLRAIKFVRHPTIPKNFSLKKAKKFLKESEELYMQARYNLRPLYYDIMGVMNITTGNQTTKRSKRNVRNRYTIRGYCTKSESNSDDVQITSDLLPYTTINVHRTSIEQVEARAGVLCQAGDMTKWEQSGIYLLPETAWELVPFSFIIDWFSNFGEVISAWAPKPGITPLTSWVTVERTLTQQMALSVVSVDNLYPHNQSLGSLWERIIIPSNLNVTVEKVTKEKTRTPNPKRSFTPSLDVNLDPLKIIDLAIIGKNLSKSIKRYRV